LQFTDKIEIPSINHIELKANYPKSRNKERINDTQNHKTGKSFVESWPNKMNFIQGKGKGMLLDKNNPIVIEVKPKNDFDLPPKLPTGIFKNLEFANIPKHNKKMEVRKERIKNIYIDPSSLFVTSAQHLLRANYGDFVLTEYQVSEIVNKVNKEKPIDFRTAAEEIIDRLRVSNIRKGNMFLIDTTFYDNNK
jgi:hypothetical protein